MDNKSQEEQMLRKYFSPRWWHWFFIINGWSTTPGESGILVRLKKDGFDFTKFSEPEIQQLIIVDKQLINARSLKAFAILLLFLGLVFILGEGVLWAITILLIAASFTCYVFGRRFAIRGSKGYKALTETLPMERRLPLPSR